MSYQFTNPCHRNTNRRSRNEVCPFFSHLGQAWNGPYQRYEQLWRELQLCDDLNFDYGFCVEHHFRPDESWISSPSLYAVGAGARTKRMRIGPMGYVVPLYHPLRLAEEIAIIDQMLGGRMEVGLVPGINSDYFKPFGLEYNLRNSPPSNSSTTCGRPMARHSRSRFRARRIIPTARCFRCSRCRNPIRRCG